MLYKSEQFAPLTIHKMRLWTARKVDTGRTERVSGGSLGRAANGYPATVGKTFKRKFSSWAT